MAYNYINARVVLDTLLENPLLSDLTLDHLITHTVDFLRLVGIPKFFEEKNVELTLVNSRVQLPLDFYEVNQIIDKEGTIDYSTTNFHFKNPNDKVLKHKYFIQNGYVNFNFTRGTVILSYQSFPMDETDVPLIPDNSSFTRALEYYIKMKKYSILFDMGKISQAVIQQVRQDYAFAVGACETEFQRFTIPEMEAFRRDNTRSVSRNNEYKSAFENLGI